MFRETTRENPFPPCVSGRIVLASQVEWDTDPGTREVQWIKTYADTGPNEIQSITTSADDVDEVQKVVSSATEVKEVQVSMKKRLLCLYCLLCCWHLRLACFFKNTQCVVPFCC